PKGASRSTHGRIAAGSLRGLTRVLDQCGWCRRQLQQYRSLGLRQHLDAPQFSVQRSPSDAGLFNDLLRVLELLVDFVENAAEFLEFGLDGGEDLPDLARTLLDRQGAEAHPQRGQ